MQPLSPRLLLGSFVFLLAVPGTVAGLVPYWISGWAVNAPLLGSGFVPVLGACALLTGMAGLLHSVMHFAREGQGTPAPTAPPKNLVVSGYYRHVRNPMYLSVLLLITGEGLILGSGRVLQYAAGLWLVFHGALVLYEEPRLARRFGDAYRVYCRHVRRWLPRFKPWNS